MRLRRFCARGILGAILLFLLPWLVPRLAMPGVAEPAGNRKDSALPTVSRYELRFNLLLKENKLEAEASMGVRNDSPNPVSEIPFILYRLFDVLEVTDEKGAAFAFSQVVVKFSDEKSLQANLVTVRLGRPLPPGKSIAVRLKYVGSLWGYPEVMAYVKDRIGGMSYDSCRIKGVCP